MNVLIILIFCLIFFYIKKMHLKIDLKSFFKKGFDVYTNRFGLTAYCGKQGTGKTYSSVRYASQLIQNGDCEIFITNLKSFYEFLITDEHLTHLNSEGILYIPDFLDIINFCLTLNSQRIVIFFDEIFTAVERTGALQSKVLEFLAQCRKRNIVVITTVQEWSELNITLRRFVRFQIDCKMLVVPFIHKGICINNINDGDTIHWSSEDNDFVSDTIQTNIHKALLKYGLMYDTFETIKGFRLLNK